MRIKWKKVRIEKEHCGDCGEMMWGDGSMVNPYTCPCGTWERDIRSPSDLIKIEPK